MTNGLRVWIRYHHGGFKESMKTKQEFCCVGMAKIAIAEEYKSYLVKNIRSAPVDVEVTHQVWDKRINSDSFIITINGNAIGHLWYEQEKK